jgi:LysM repeat protein
MQRDLGNEVIVAIAAVGILAFAITFAIILSLTNTPEATPTVTVSGNTGGSPVATSVAASASETPSPQVEATEAEITVTPSNAATSATTIASGTAAPEASETKVAIAPSETDTSEPASNTPDVTATEQELTSADISGTAPTVGNATATKAQPQVNPSRTPSPTRRPPTATSSFTPSPTITRTPSPVPPTNTATRTPTRTPSPTPTLTRTPRPTETSGIRPTPTGILTQEAVAVPGSCIKPTGWTTYVVRQGDTLLKIARAVGSSLFELQTANCLQDINNIFAGNIIFVPRTPVSPINPNPVPNDTPVYAPIQPEGCTDPNSVITNLQPGQTVSGVFSVIGTANQSDFWYYKLEVRPDFASVYNFYSRSETPVVNGQLGQIDQSIFGVGIHWIKLTVLGQSSGATPCAIPVIFQ